jgi:hypothetical protein
MAEGLKKSDVYAISAAGFIQILAGYFFLHVVL